MTCVCTCIQDEPNLYPNVVKQKSPTTSFMNVFKIKGRDDTDEYSHIESNREIKTAKINKIVILELEPHYLT